MIEMYCPSCGHHLRIDQKYVGDTGACKHCKETFTVPEQGDIPASSYIEPPPAADTEEIPAAQAPPVAASPGAPASLGDTSLLEDGQAPAPSDAEADLDILKIPDLFSPDAAETKLSDVGLPGFSAEGAADGGVGLAPNSFDDLSGEMSSAFTSGPVAGAVSSGGGAADILWTIAKAGVVLTAVVAGISAVGLGGYFVTQAMRPHPLVGTWIDELDTKAYQFFDSSVVMTTQHSDSRTRTEADYLLDDSTDPGKITMKMTKVGVDGQDSGMFSGAIGGLLGQALLPTLHAVYRVEGDTLYIAFESMEMTQFGIEIGSDSLEYVGSDSEGDEDGIEETPRPPGFEGQPIFETLYREQVSAEN